LRSSGGAILIVERFYKQTAGAPTLYIFSHIWLIIQSQLLAALPQFTEQNPQ